MFDVSILDSIDADFLQQAVAQKTPESLTLDFKGGHYDMTDTGKRAFLEDVSSFANTAGGFLVIGVAEDDDGCAQTVKPIANLNPDQDLLALENLVRDSIEPRIQGLQIRAIPVQGGHVLVLHIPKSWNPPHRIKFRKYGTFHGRNSKATYPLDIEEIRRRFLMASEFEQRASDFVSERTMTITTSDMGLRTPFAEAVIIMHLVPLGPAARDEVADWQKPLLESNLAHSFKPMMGASYTPRINLDGLLFYRGSDVCYGYTQLFRNGAVEATKYKNYRNPENPLSPTNVGSTYLSGVILHNVESYLQAMKAINTPMPIMVSVSLHNFQNSQLKRGSDYWFEDSEIMMHRTVALPKVLFAEVPEVGQTSIGLRPILDTLWQAYGFTDCGALDDKGLWSEKKPYTQF